MLILVSGIAVDESTVSVRQPHLLPAVLIWYE